MPITYAYSFEVPYYLT